jgi:voltage-gated potassium channel
VLQFESGSPDANIKTGGDAIWWGIVSLTTVGYGDFFPVTFLGRLTGVALMIAGIGIIGALASILASLLVAPATPEEPSAEPAGAPALAPAPVPTADPPATSAIVEELAALRVEIAALRASLSGDHADRR